MINTMVPIDEPGIVVKPLKTPQRKRPSGLGIGSLFSGDASPVLSPRSMELIEQIKLKAQQNLSTSSDDDSSSDSSSESEQDKRDKKKRKKKDKKKRKKKKKRRKKSRSESEEEEEEQVKEIKPPQPVISVEGNGKKRRVVLKDDIRLFNKLRPSKDPNDAEQRGIGENSLSDGEIRESSPYVTKVGKQPERESSKIPINFKISINNSKKDNERVQREEISKRRSSFRNGSHSRDSSSSSGSSSYRSDSSDRDRRRRRRRRSYSEQRRSRSRRLSYDDRRSPRIDLSPLKDGYCEDCQVVLNESNAYEHFSSKMHRLKTMYKIRCYLCSKYVENPKMHLERNHARDVFQCQGRNCSNPKFLDLNKIVNHMEDRHHNDLRDCHSNDDLLRFRLISAPANLSSYKCKVCNRQFVGQDIRKVLQHMKWEDGVKDPSLRDIYYHCRICGSDRCFGSDKDLQNHCRQHGVRSMSPPPRARSKSSRREYYSRSSRRSSTSRSRSPHRSTSTPRRQQRRQYIQCTFCPQVTETNEYDRRKHVNSYHRSLIFKCKVCRDGAVDCRLTSREKVIQHIKDRHREEWQDNADEEEIIKNVTIVPPDLKRIYCFICEPNDSKSENGDEQEKKTKLTTEWWCQEIIDIEPLLHEHREENHPSIKSLNEIIRLGCRLCSEFHNFDFEFRRDWKKHIEESHGVSNGSVRDRSRSRSKYSARSRSRHRSRSTSRSSVRSARSNSSLRSEDEENPDNNSSAPVCFFCCQPFPPGENRIDHTKQHHKEHCFRCLVCPESDPFLSEERSKVMKHVRKTHPDDFHDEAKEEKQLIGWPNDLRCIQCMMCQLTFYAVGESEMQSHFRVSHGEDSDASGFLDRKCRICMESGEFDDDQEMLKHLSEEHGDKKPKVSTVTSTSENTNVGPTPTAEPVKVEESTNADNQSQVKKAMRFVIPIGTVRMTNCPICKDLLPFDIHPHFEEKHVDQCFECKKCENVICLDLETAKRHLKDDENLDPSVRDVLLASLRFPSDHQQVKCLKCGEQFIGPEGNNRAKEHFSKKHGNDSASLEQSLLLSCRCCSERISSALEFEAHTITCFAKASQG